MSGTPSKGGGRIAAVVVLLPLLAGAYYMAPLLLPVWRWENIRWEEQARALGVSEEKLRQPYDIVFRHSERGPGDPLPWQLLEMTPAWEGGEEPEAEVAVRATIVSDRSGNPVSSLSLGSGHYKDRYFKAKAWRFKPGSFGFNPHRPVIVFDAMSLEKAGISECGRYEEIVGTQQAPKWHFTDDDVEDGYVKPGAE